MSEYLKDKDPDSYGDNAAKNQKLFDKEMYGVVDAPGFNELFEKLLNAGVIATDGSYGKVGGVYFSKEQSARVISWSRNFSMKEPASEYIVTSPTINIDRAIINMLMLGDKYVSLGDEDLEYCLRHNNQRVRHIACLRFELTEYHIDKVLELYSNQKSATTTMPGIIIDRYAKSLSPGQVEAIQLRCEMYDCCSLWFNGVGDSPIKKLLGMKKYEFVSSFNEENFLSWRIDYKAGLEAARLKEVFGVNGVKDLRDLCNPLIKVQRAL